MITISSRVKRHIVSGPEEDNLGCAVSRAAGEVALRRHPEIALRDHARGCTAAAPLEAFGYPWQLAREGARSPRNLSRQEPHRAHPDRRVFGPRQGTGRRQPSPSPCPLTRAARSTTVGPGIGSAAQSASPTAWFRAVAAGAEEELPHRRSRPVQAPWQRYQQSNICDLSNQHLQQDGGGSHVRQRKPMSRVGRADYDWDAIKR